MVILKKKIEFFLNVLFWWLLLFLQHLCLQILTLYCFVMCRCFSRYVLFTAYTLTTAINEWSSMLYSVIYTALPTIVVGILDKDLSKRTLLMYPQLYGAGQRREAYNKRLFWFTMADTFWQSTVVFFVPLFAYWGSTVDISSIGDLWTLSVVILVNLHLAMDVIRWTWVIHAAVWGSIIATFICVMIIDAIPAFPGYWYVLPFPILSQFFIQINLFWCTWNFAHVSF